MTMNYIVTLKYLPTADELDAELLTAELLVELFGGNKNVVGSMEESKDAVYVDGWYLPTDAPWLSMSQKDSDATLIAKAVTRIMERYENGFDKQKYDQAVENNPNSLISRTPFYTVPKIDILGEVCKELSLDNQLQTLIGMLITEIPREATHWASDWNDESF